MGKMKLILGFSASLPQYLTRDEYERFYQNICKPLLSKLYSMPEILVPMYFSGSLLEFIEFEHPEFLTVITEMIKRKQIEIVGSGFYEPFFPMIPASDRVGQIELLTTMIRKSFGKRPRGFYVPYQVWDQSMASVLKSCGIDYFFLDKDYFVAAGMKDSQLFTPFLTEDQGKMISAFPLFSLISSIQQNRESAEILEEWLQLPRKDEQNPIISSFISLNDLIDDQYKWDERMSGWLHDFFMEIKRRTEIELILPNQYIRKVQPGTKNIFLQSASYRRIYHWLENKLSPRLLKLQNQRNEGSFRQILSTVKESNRLYCKMRYVSILANQLRGDRARKKSAREEIWKSQEHSHYHFLPFGGLTELRARRFAYSCLIEAERITRQRGIFIPSISCFDYDMDGRKDFIYQGHEINAYIKESEGSIFEFDLIKKGINYLDVLGLDPQAGFFNEEEGDDFENSDTFSDFITLHEDEGGDEGDRIGSVQITGYQVDNFERENRHLTMSTELKTRMGRKNLQLGLWKKYFFRKMGIEVHYRITNTSNKPIRFTFTTINNLALDYSSEYTYWSEGNKRGTFSALDKSEVKELSSLDIYDRENKVDIAIKTSPLCEMNSQPIFSRTVIPRIRERGLQSCRFLPSWSLDLKEGESWSGQVGMTFASRKTSEK